MHQLHHRRPLLLSVAVLSAAALLTTPAVHAAETSEASETLETVKPPRAIEPSEIREKLAIDETPTFSAPTASTDETVSKPEDAPEEETVSPDPSSETATESENTEARETNSHSEAEQSFAEETLTEEKSSSVDEKSTRTTQSAQESPEASSSSSEIPAVTKSAPRPEAAPETAAEPEAPVEKVKVIVETTDQPALARADRKDSSAFNEALETAEADVTASYENIAHTLVTDDIHLTMDDHFYGAFSGFSTTVDPEDIEKIKRLKNVQSVTVQRVFKPLPIEPNMVFAGDLVGFSKEEREEIPYQGENIVVSVIDSGIDPDHKDLTLADNVEKRYDEAQMNDAIASLGLPGRWYSNKIPYGYNYADETQNVKSPGGVHGQHVSGIIGANGDPENDGIAGVAPHVQILAMKVFGNGMKDGGTTEDIYIKAIDDSIKLGADVLNLSLGAPAGFNLDPDSPIERALQLARSQGVLPVIAMGNDRNITQGLPGNSSVVNPDTSLAGEPALSDSALAVASIDNAREMLPVVIATANGQEYKFKSLPSSQVMSNDEPKRIVFAGLGRPEDYAELGDISDANVLIQRGEITFGEKYQEARKHNVAGVLIYDNEENPELLGMAGMEQADIPVNALTKEDGEKLLELIQTHDNVETKISDEVSDFPFETAGNISDFSTWGPTPDLRLKPEIAAPGGSIYSTVFDDQHLSMSGTSMATPYVSGVAALLIQRLYADDLLNGSPADKDVRQDDLVKLILMNTAAPADNTVDGDASYYSPIQQGAGVVNVSAALRDFVTITATGTNDTTPDGKLEIKEVDDSFDADFELTNYGDEAVTYTIEFVSLKDNSDENGQYTETTAIAQKSYEGQITVDAHDTAHVELTLPTFDIPDDQYVHGFFFFKDINDEVPTLSVPFLGFKGDWNAAPLLDGLEASGESVNFPAAHIIDGDGFDKISNQTGFLFRDEAQGLHFWNSFNVDGQPTVFVNTADKDGFTTEIVPNLSFLRNARNVTFNITDAEGEVIRTLSREDRVVKVNQLYLNPSGVRTLSPARAWDFKDFYDQEVPDGVYHYVIEGTIDSVGREPQTFDYTIVIDNESPELQVERQDDTLIVNASDELAGIAEITLFDVAHNLTDHHPIQPADGPLVTRTTQEIAIPTHFDSEELQIIVRDNAGNYRTLDLVSDEETTGVEIPKLPEIDPNALEDTLTKLATGVLDMANNAPEAPEEVTFREIDNPEAYSQDEGILSLNLPLTRVEEPAQFAFYNWSQDSANIKGTVTNLKELHRIELTLTDEAGDVIIDHQPVPTSVTALPSEIGDLKLFTFEDTIALPENEETGVYHLDVRIFGETNSDQLVQQAIGRTLIIDRTSPEVYIERGVGVKPDRAYFVAYFSDDSNLLDVRANNSQIVSEDLTYKSFLPFGIERAVVFDVPLKQGENTIVFTVSDETDNKTYEWKFINHGTEQRDDAFYVEELNTEIAPYDPEADNTDWNVSAKDPIDAVLTDHPDTSYRDETHDGDNPIDIRVDVEEGVGRVQLADGSWLKVALSQGEDTSASDLTHPAEDPINVTITDNPDTSASDLAHPAGDPIDAVLTDNPDSSDRDKTHPAEDPIDVTITDNPDTNAKDLTHPAEDPIDVTITDNPDASAKDLTHLAENPIDVRVDGEAESLSVKLPDGSWLKITPHTGGDTSASDLTNPAEDPIDAVLTDNPDTSNHEKTHPAGEPIDVTITDKLATGAKDLPRQDNNLNDHSTADNGTNSASNSPESRKDADKQTTGVAAHTANAPYPDETTVSTATSASSVKTTSSNEATDANQAISHSGQEEKQTTLPQTGFVSHLWLGLTSLFGGAVLFKRRRK